MKKGKVVLASGTFDLFHFGHIRYLEEAKKAGGENTKLIVIVARDRTVADRKGKRPVMSEDQRRAVLEALEVVDDAVLGYDEFSIQKAIEKIKPDVIAVGHDQADIEKEVRRAVADMGLDIQVVRIGRFGENELDSSSEIKRKIIESFDR